MSKQSADPPISSPPKPGGRQTPVERPRVNADNPPPEELRAATAPFRSPTMTGGEAARAEGMVSLLFGEDTRPPTDPPDGEAAATGFLRRLPLKKMVIWFAFLGLLYLLKPFFGVVLVTFVLSYIASSAVGRAGRLLGQRVPRAALIAAFYLVLLGLLVAFVWATLPRVVDQGRTLLRNLGGSLAESAGAPEARPGSIFPGAGFEPWPSSAPPAGTAATAPPPEGQAGAPADWWTGPLAGFFGRERFAAWRQTWLSDELLAELGEMLKGTRSVALGAVQGVLQATVAGVLAFLVALLFSFMIVFDAPHLARSLRRLEHTRLRGAYREVAPSVVSFGRLLGQAFQVQTMIALVNTALTALGMALIGIHPIGFLSVVVFLCSFIPVAGVFISTVPIGLVALGEDGIGGLLLVIAVITGVHLVEAYLLNPRLYSLKMKMHPLVTLMILYVSERLLGVWGLVVCVPLSVFIYRYLILGDEEPLTPLPESAE